MRKSIILSIWSLFAFCAIASANTDRYRLALRDDPATSMVIGWEQDGGSGAMVYYGTTDFGTNWASYPNSQAPDRTVNAMGMDNSFVRLTGLTPDTKYYFVIKDSDGVSSRFWFETIPLGNSEPLSVLAGGDSRADINQGPRENANLMAAKLRADFIMFGGDYTVLNTGFEWQGWLDDWQLTIAADGRMTPVIWERGNHELSAGDVTDMFDIPTTNDEYYALSIGGNFLRVYTLNSEISVAGNQKTWLESDLAANYQTHDWNFAQYHRCMKPHTTEKTNGDDKYNAWAQIFHDYRVQLVVESDAHDVKTTWPVKPSSGPNSEDGFELDTIAGTVYIGEGCWGAPIRTADWNRGWTRNSGSFNSFHWLKITKDTIEIRTVETDNAAAASEVDDNDRFTIPAGVNIWNPSNGSVVYIRNQKYIDRPDVQVSYPFHQQHFGTPQQITITANASDVDGTVEEVKFYVNDVLIGNDLVAPYELDWTMPTDGDYTITAWAIDNGGWHNVSDNVRIFAGEIDITTSLLSDNDDAEEYKSDGSVDLSSSDLELCIEEWTWPLSDENQWVGLRFDGIEIPQGASIIDAYIQFTADEDQSGSCNLIVRGEDVDDASEFSGGDYNLSSRDMTTAQVAWAVSGWTSESASVNERTPNLSIIVEEITSRVGWSNGNALAFLIEGNGTRSAYSRDEDAGKSAKLHIKYSYSSPSSVEELNDERFKIYPNPAAEYVIIEPPVAGKSFDLSIYDVSGKHVMSKSNLMGTTQINLEDSVFTSGMYIFKLNNTTEKIWVK